MSIITSLGIFLGRLQGYLIRLFLKVNGLGGRDTVRLLGGEYSPKIDFEVLDVMPGGVSIANKFQRRQGIERFIFQDRYLLRLENTLHDTMTGVLFTESRKLIEESSAWNKDFLRASGFPRPLVRPKPVTKVSDCILLPSNGFYHWLLEDLPNFIRTIEHYPNSTILLFENCPPYARDFLTSINKEFLSVPRYISSKSTIFFTRGDSSGWPDKRDIDVLRNQFRSTLRNQKQGSKVYVSRRYSSRSPEFEIELEDDLNLMGWQIVYAENLKLEDQVKIFSQAEVICGVGGAGLSSIIWAENGTKLIELSPEWYSPCFSRLCAAIGMEYRCIFFEDPKLGLQEILSKISEAICN